MLSSTITTSSSAISLTTAIGLGIGGGLVALFLITLLSMKEVITPTKYFTKIKTNLNVVITPLLFTFSAIVVYKVLSLGII